MLVSLVGAHLVHGVDGVADGAVDDGLLGLVQARLGVVTHARDELGPHLRVRVAGTKKRVKKSEYTAGVLCVY